MNNFFNDLLFILSLGVIIFGVAWMIRGIVKSVIVLINTYVAMDTANIKNLLARLKAKDSAILTPEAQRRIKKNLFKSLKK